MVSLYACNELSKIEVGKFGMPLTEAKNNFLTTVSKNGLAPKTIEEKDDKVTIRFQFENSEIYEKLENLIADVARVSVLRGNPPSKYCLVEEKKVKSGEYLRTNCYCG
jgi:hypothetical protein